MVETSGADGKEGAYSTHSGGRGFRGHALRTDRYRFLRWIAQRGDVGLVELYDYENDPLETRNIAAAHPKLVDGLTQKLAVKIAEVVQSSHVE